MTDHARAALAQEIAETFFGKYLDPKEAGHSARLQHIILAALSRASAAPTTARCHCGGYTFSCCACGSSIHAEQPTPPPAAPSGEQLRAALDAAKHAMADVQTWLDFPDQSEAWHRLNREIAAAEKVLAAHPSPAVPPPSD